MKVVCIDTNIKNDFYGAPTQPLEYGKVYEASLVFYSEDSNAVILYSIGNPIEWNNNFLNLDGFSELDWFPTENFTTLDSWREKILSGIL